MGMTKFQLVLFMLFVPFSVVYLFFVLKQTNILLYAMIVPLSLILYPTPSSEINGLMRKKFLASPETKHVKDESRLKGLIRFLTNDSVFVPSFPGYMPIWQLLVFFAFIALIICFILL